ncbi:uncharacterized protein KIAA0754 isoform X5 [Poecilia formosa]|uniref:uncharacterized protein KIAA0754 isoform X5 n=1 Tax=Poecilia formosa TaxID=48698 RepID=UPI0007B8C9A6|nr:PREDICTED: uncharacterized protein KIAA0754-like isoform X5 [Poecilia formosa]
MFSCRAAWQRCGPLARRATYRLPLDGVQRRPMSSVPGGSGQNILYTVLCGGALVGALSYGYKTVTSDHDRFNDRISELRARPKTEWTPKPWPPKGKDEDGEADAGEEEAAAATAAAEAETIVEEAAEVVAEAAEAVSEAAEAVAQVAQEVEAAAEEVAKVAEAVEEAAQAVTEPAAVGAEETQSDVPLAAASSLELLKKAKGKDDSASNDQELLPPEVETPVEKVSPTITEVLTSDGDTSLKAVAISEETVTPEEDGKVSVTVKVAPAMESLTPVEVVSMEDSAAFAEVAPVVEDVSVPIEVSAVAVEAPPTIEVAAVVEKILIPAEVVPVVEETSTPAEVAPVVEEAPVPTEVVAVVEAPASTEVAPVMQETPVLVDSSKEYIVVVLEGTPKEEKRPKVLGVGPMTGRIIPAPEDDGTPASEGRRRLLRIQMQ